MAGRYLVTGVQIGMLKSLRKKEERNKLLDEILEKQFIGESNTPVNYDAERLADVCSKF